MAEFLIKGEITYGTNSTGNQRRNAMQSVFTSYPTVIGSNDTVYSSGIGGSGATVTISCIAPDRETAEAFERDMVAAWSAATRSAGYIAVARVGAL